jgi:hypothetical protein
LLDSPINSVFVLSMQMIGCAAAMRSRGSRVLSIRQQRQRIFETAGELATAHHRDARGSQLDPEPVGYIEPVIVPAQPLGHHGTSTFTVSRRPTNPEGHTLPGFYGWMEASQRARGAARVKV